MTENLNSKVTGSTLEMLLNLILEGEDELKQIMKLFVKERIKFIKKKFNSVD
jgi:hypothetical protein